ncbi:MAG: hypothetical protein K8S27_14850 [Candidatus Omnitrophica bacterium]|nr:hypothetical protein [Candidatus Omnitrophota bacterium]
MSNQNDGDQIERQNGLCIRAAYTKSINKLLDLNSEKQNWFWSLFDGIGIIFL